MSVHTQVHKLTYSYIQKKCKIDAAQVLHVRYHKLVTHELNAIYRHSCLAHSEFLG